MFTPRRQQGLAGSPWKRISVGWSGNNQDAPWYRNTESTGPQQKKNDEESNSSTPNIGMMLQYVSFDAPK